jgi:hypothetical protein
VTATPACQSSSIPSPLLCPSHTSEIKRCDDQLNPPWQQLYYDAFISLYKNPSKLAGKKPPAHPAPKRGAAFYAGTYENAYYGKVKVVSRGGEQRVLIGPRPNEYPLTHWSGNEFAFYPTGESALGISAANFLGKGAKAGALRLEYYNDNGWGTLIRV